MQGNLKRALLAICILFFLLGGAREFAVHGAEVDAARMEHAHGDVKNWLSHGRTYDEQRFSPDRQINVANVSNLALAWHHDLDVAHRGQESTPLVIDGVMYVTGAWSKVFALDARTGKLLWAYDPKVPGKTAVYACCDVVNRGVAAWKGRVFLGTLDGRLVALDARSGSRVWEVMTVPPDSRYTITGAPRVVKDKVIIGNGGAELGVRGYVSAYDAASGKLVWRFYTVPGNPAEPFENAALAKAARTWTGQWWKLGGGGTVWDSIAFDPALGLLYIGVGNGSPWNRALRSPGGGDNLFLSSIVALRADTGQYVWHYQTTPGDSWDYTATQHMILADLPIRGRKRRVLMQAPKNGFFYVLDRASGELLSARNYAPINWASGIDLKSGRPVENPEARYGETGKPWLAMPGPPGAHNWHPMAFSPLTRLVYVPVSEMGFNYVPDDNFRETQLGWNTGADIDAISLPQDNAIKAQIKSTLKGALLAWDPVAQKEAWRVPYPYPVNGGVMATGGNLVFQGSAAGELTAFRADTGAKVWSAITGAGVLAPPISYRVDGEQYIALEVGWGGGGFNLAGGELARDAHVAANTPRVLAFKLGGKDQLPPADVARHPAIELPADTATAASATAGKALYHRYCGACHGDSAVSSGVLPDLRFSAALGSADVWRAIVRDGILEQNGMVAFGAEIGDKDAELIRQYVVHRAHEQRTLESAPHRASSPAGETNP